MKLKVSEEEARQRQSLRPESSQILDLDICVRRLVTKNSEFEGSQQADI